jgi:hypothetical protein
LTLGQANKTIVDAEKWKTEKSEIMAALDATKAKVRLSEPEKYEICVLTLPAQ